MTEPAAAGRQAWDQLEKGGGRASSLRSPNTSVRFYIPEGYRADIEDAAVLESGNYEFHLWKA